MSAWSWTGCALLLWLAGCGDSDADDHRDSGTKPIDADAGSEPIDAGSLDPEAGRDAGVPAFGDEREGYVSCGDDSCPVDQGDAVCCYEAPTESGACVSPRNACGIDDQGFGCDGPEDCGAGEACCLIEGDRVGWCSANCTDDTVCHTHDDCQSHERCEPMAHGYGRCVTDDDRNTVGYDGANRVFCGDDVCDRNEHCCIGDTAADTVCRASPCPDGAVTIECDGNEDCLPEQACFFEDERAKCQPGRNEGQPEFVCHDTEDCNGYDCVPRDGVPSIGFCDPNTGT